MDRGRSALDDVLSGRPDPNTRRNWSPAQRRLIRPSACGDLPLESGLRRQVPTATRTVVFIECSAPTHPAPSVKIASTVMSQVPVGRRTSGPARNERRKSARVPGHPRRRRPCGQRPRSVVRRRRGRGPARRRRPGGSRDSEERGWRGRIRTFDLLIQSQVPSVSAARQCVVLKTVRFEVRSLTVSG